MPGPDCVKLVIDRGELILGAPRWFRDLGSQVAFAGNHPQHGSSIFFTDGTRTGTRWVLAFDDDQSPQQSRETPVVWNGKLFFNGKGGEVWVVGANGEHDVLDVPPGSVQSSFSRLQAFEGGVAYACLDGARKPWLCVTDGASVKKLIEGKIGEFFGTFEGKLFFTTVHFENGKNVTRLYLTDGTTLSLLTEIPSSFGDHPVVWNGALWFPQDNKGSDSLWSTDGTPTGTRQAVTLPDSRTRSLIAARDQLFFITIAAKTGEEFWRSDGTQAGTYLIQDLSDGSDGGVNPTKSRPHPADVVGNRLFFTGRTQWTGEALLIRTDGTRDAMDQVAVEWDHFSNIWAAGGSIFAFATKASTPAGTRLLRVDPATGAATEIAGLEGKLPESLAFLAGKLWIGINGGQLWTLTP